MMNAVELLAPEVGTRHACEAFGVCRATLYRHRAKKNKVNPDKSTEKALSSIAAKYPDAQSAIDANRFLALLEKAAKASEEFRELEDLRRNVWSRSDTSSQTHYTPSTSTAPSTIPIEVLQRYNSPEYLDSPAGKIWQEHPDWDNPICDLIVQRKVRPGMSKEQILLAWGSPKEKTSSSREDSWLYGKGTRLIFNGDFLLEIHKPQ